MSQSSIRKICKQQCNKVHNSKCMYMYIVLCICTLYMYMCVNNLSHMVRIGSVKLVSNLRNCFPFLVKAFISAPDDTNILSGGVSGAPSNSTKVVNIIIIITIIIIIINKIDKITMKKQPSFVIALDYHKQINRC